MSHAALNVYAQLAHHKLPDAPSFVVAQILPTRRLASLVEIPGQPIPEQNAVIVYPVGPGESGVRLGGEVIERQGLFADPTGEGPVILQHVREVQAIHDAGSPSRLHAMPIQRHAD